MLELYMTALVCCTGCPETFKLATFAPTPWRAETADLRAFLETHRSCAEGKGEKAAFTLRYEDT